MRRHPWSLRSSPSPASSIDATRSMQPLAVELRRAFERDPETGVQGHPHREVEPRLDLRHAAVPGRRLATPSRANWDELPLHLGQPVGLRAHRHAVDQRAHHAPVPLEPLDQGDEDGSGAVVRLQLGANGSSTRSARPAARRSPGGAAARRAAPCPRSSGRASRCSRRPARRPGWWTVRRTPGRQNLSSGVEDAAHHLLRPGLDRPAAQGFPGHRATLPETRVEVEHSLTLA